mgnify:CR=1 FL=1
MTTLLGVLLIFLTMIAGMIGMLYMALDTRLWVRVLAGILSAAVVILFVAVYPLLMPWQ